MIRRKLYFNGKYLIKGRIIFGKIRGKIISSRYDNIYAVGEKVRMNPETFEIISNEKYNIMREWGYFND